MGDVETKFYGAVQIPVEAGIGSCHAMRGTQVAWAVSLKTELG